LKKNTVQWLGLAFVVQKSKFLRWKRRSMFVRVVVLSWCNSVILEILTVSQISRRMDLLGWILGAGLRRKR
jgi:hypothetical protein